MNLRAFPVVAVIVLSATGKIWTWWGVAILAVCLVAGFLAAVAAQERGYGYQGEDESDAVRGYVCVCVSVPSFAGAVVGSIAWDGWGAAIGGIGTALVPSTAYGLLAR